MAESCLPVLGRPPAAVLEQLRCDVLARCEQDMDFAPVETCAGQERDVTVTAMLAERCRCLPQGGDWVVRPGEFAVGGKQRSSGCDGTADRLVKDGQYRDRELLSSAV